MSTPDNLRDLEARGLRLVPVGGRPPKTARDVAVYLAAQWFEAGAASARPKIGQSVVALWASKGYTGLTDPAHVVARKAAARAAVGDDHTVMVQRGAGTARNHIGEGAGALLVPASSMTADEAGALEFHGPVWSWTHGAETAKHYEAAGLVAYRPKN